ncbi:UNVERIFIED_CONTAM: hypothetical protein Sradi_0312500 [Sesamum radiatum]|uniref:FAM192A/Fyv6 N-terminal domain-containing protein n=1 Tax=Sesamum radiatum TaxID=300843 RepID=A0AAW2W785_SESRA
MADDEMPPPLRLMNFVSEDQLEEARRTRGARVDDGTAQRDRSLYEILKENKDKKDAEFNERFKHRPPKALDEDETEFLDKLEMAAVASQSEVVRELKETPSVPKSQDKNSVAGRKNLEGRPLGMIIKVKKAKVESGDSGETPTGDRKEAGEATQKVDSDMDVSRSVGISGLVSYSDDESEEDE